MKNRTKDILKNYGSRDFDCAIKNVLMYKPKFSHLLNDVLKSVGFIAYIR